jgi:hypothetical protein
MTGERRTIVALSAVCLGFLGVTVWALATRGDGASSSTSAEGSVFWVGTKGDDAAAGSRDEPWATIQHAADSVGPGATVLVLEGVYEQRL